MESDFPWDDHDNDKSTEEDTGDDRAGQTDGDGDEEMNGTESKDVKSGNNDEDNGDDVNDGNDENRDMDSNWSEEDPPRPELEQWKKDFAKACQSSAIVKAALLSKQRYCQSSATVSWSAVEAEGVELRENGV
jgi:hypothetical protein